MSDSEHASPTPDADSHADAQTNEHVKSHIRTFVIVFGCLMGLTLISFGIANSSLMDTPIIGWTAMMAASCCKAFLVICFFMHLKWETNWKFVLTIPATVMSILVVMILVPDVMHRVEDYDHSRKTHAAEPNTASYAIADEAEDH